MKLAVTLLALSAGCALAQPTLRVPLQPVADRPSAPAFALEDAAGKTVRLKQYRGKVVLLDFWATWCHGCKEEIPWFSEFQKIYGRKGLAVIGVSMDEDGWKVLRPFLAQNRVPYRMLLGDASMAKPYGAAESLPDTFLIDRKGKIAAAYRAGLVDRQNIEANIQALLEKR